MGRYRWAPEYDSSGYRPVGQTRIDDETGDQEHFDTDRMLLKGRSVSDGHGHLTHLDEDGVGCRGHSYADGDHFRHTDRDGFAVGHTDGDRHTGLDRLSTRGFTGGGGGSAGFHEFHGDEDEEDDEPSPSSHGHEDEDESDSYDNESGSTGCVPMSEEEAARAVQYGNDILERVRRKDEAAQERLRAQFEHIRGNYFDPNAPTEVAEEPAEPAPRRRRSPSRRRSQPCNGDAWGWALAAFGGLVLIAGTTLALVFGLRNRNETSDTHVSSQASPSQISEYARDLKLLLLRERLFCRPDGVQGPETDSCDMTEERLSDKIGNPPPELDDNAIDIFGIRLLLKDERIICGIDRIQTIRTGVRTTDGCIQAEQELDDKLGEIHTDFNDMDNLDRALLLASELHSCRPGMPRSKECIQIGQILGEESGASVAVESNPQYVAPQPSVPEPRPAYTPPRRAHRARPETVHPRPINPPRNPVETERERVNRELREWNPGLSNAELRARAGSLAPLFEDPPPSSPSLSDRINSIHVPPVPPVPYDSPRWRPRTEPKREQYAQQPRQDWQRQRR